MKMKTYIAASILAAALLASGCGKFVRDELILMQNEIDALTDQVEQMNQALADLQTVVHAMENGGYITDVASYADTSGKDSVYVLTFNNMETLELFTGIDGKDGQDAVPPEIGMKQDEEDGRWYWTLDGEWIVSDEGGRFLVDGVDGRTPALKVEEGYWYISWDGGETWTATEWKARGDDAYEVFSLCEVFDDRVELTLASDSTVLVLPRFLDAELTLTLEGQDLEGDVLIAPGETLSIHYSVTGTDADSTLVVAGTDGRFKTAIKPETATEGTVEVTCPETFPEGGYIYITLNDGNGRSKVKLVRFAERLLNLEFGNLDYSLEAKGDSLAVTFSTNSELEFEGVFPEGVEPWFTVTPETAEGFYSLGIAVQANEAAEARSACILISPKDHPGFEMERITVNQAGKPAETPTGE